MNTDFGLPVGERWELGTRHLGQRVLVCPRLDSTNARLLALVGQPGAEGLALIAEEQSAGRGQHGRSWLARRGSSVLLSLLLYPPAELCRPALLTAWAAVAVGEVVQRHAGRSASIKWPNDVLLLGRKVCGILIETSHSQGRLATVVGIGLNVNQTEEDFRAAGLPEATSLGCHQPDVSDALTIARELLQVLDEDYDRLCAGQREALELRWARGLGLLEEHVVVECRDGELRGRLIELTLDRITLWRGERNVFSLPPEAILHLRHA